MVLRSLGSRAIGMRAAATIAIVLAAFALASVAVLMFAGPTRADPPATLLDAPPHRHFIRTSEGTLVPVGPQICDNPALQQAFNEFHYNIHHSVLPGNPPLPVLTLGPQDGAPGLHNLRGANLTAMQGCPANP